MKFTCNDILYEDKEIIVCRKQAGIATQTSRLGEADMDSALKNYLKTPYLGVVHRLDQPVEGILVFAKTKEAAAKLSMQSTRHIMNKEYYAAVMLLRTGEAGKEYCLVDYLIKNGKDNMSKVAEKGVPQAKRAELSYEILKTEQTEAGGQAALLRVTLKTGRHHQIRVQLSNAGLPLLGDSKYGSEASRHFSQRQNIRNIALCAYHLEFYHPVTGKKMSFKIEPSGSVFQIFSMPINS